MNQREFTVQATEHQESSQILDVFMKQVQEKIGITLDADSIDSHISYIPSNKEGGFTLLFDKIEVGHITYEMKEDEKHPNGKHIVIHMFGTTNLHSDSRNSSNLPFYRDLQKLPTENPSIKYLWHVLFAHFVRTHAQWYTKIFLDVLDTKEYWRDKVGKFLVTQGLITRAHSQGMEVVYTLPSSREETSSLEAKLARYGITPP